MPEAKSNGQLFTRREAAKRHNRSYATIRCWELRGWLTPVAENPKRYTAAALDAAAIKADEAQREAYHKANRASRSKSDQFKSPGRILLLDAMHRLKVSRRTMTRWLRSCLYLPNRRGIKHWPENQKGVPIHVATADIETIESKIADGHLQTVKQKHLARVRKKAIEKSAEKRRMKPGGLGSVYDAAVWAGVSHYTIRRNHKSGELKAASKNPLRFDRDVVKAWSASQTKTQDDLAIIDIPARLPGPPGKFKHGRSEKLKRIHRIITRLRIETYRRWDPGKPGKRRLTCIRQERFAEVEAEYLTSTTGEPDELRPGEIKLRDAVKRNAESIGTFIKAQKTIRKALAKHAPDCVRTLNLKRRNGSRYTADVAPRAAIEAALRGEDWTPPPETPAPQSTSPLPAETTDAPPEQSNGQTSTPAKPVAAKARPGRRSEWKNLLKVYDRLREQNPETEERDLRRYAVQQYNRQYGGRGKNPKAAKLANLRRALAHRRSQSEQNSP